jgi:transcriptional regulator with PAS, ATPase and Fis domain
LSKIERPVRQVGMSAYTPVADERGSAEPTFRSSRFLRALAQAERFARDRSAPILIEGESGTGKTQLARHIHRHSPRCGVVQSGRHEHTR